jgi:uncharacterized membrane protein YgdD (TMEM256/DUF423 family)|tara:strand:- start:10584 stop:10964 length:381 start_codon:yes stop_codon:yes gene_type:complete
MEKYIRIAILLICTGIVLGALGAHSLNEIINKKNLEAFETGTRYQLFHGIAILLLSLNSKKFNILLNRCLNTMIIGILFFSLSIYLLSTQDIIGVSLMFLGPLTPLGGALLILSWIILFFSIKKNT